MGGKGSGRQRYSARRGSPGKSATGDSLGLDVRALQRAGRLRPGVYALWQWYRGAAIPENKVASIGLRAHRSGVTLLYSHAGDLVEQNVCVVRTACNYGGSRVWWQCPACARRVAIIYGAGKFFACRHCYQLCYFSQQEQQRHRWLRAAWKIRQRLGQTEGGHFDRLPDKPKGMHWETYSRLCLRCEELEQLDFAMIAAQFGF